MGLQKNSNIAQYNWLKLKVKSKFKTETCVCKKNNTLDNTKWLTHTI